MKECLYYVHPYMWGFLSAIILGWLFIPEIMRELKKKIYPVLSKKEEIDAYDFYPSIVGRFETVLYITALQLKHPEFIAGWLALKIAGRWTSPALKKDDREELPEKESFTPEQKFIVNCARYNIFTIGNALSIIYAVLGWKIIVWLQLDDPIKICKIISFVLATILGSCILLGLAKFQTDRLIKLFINKDSNSFKQWLGSAALNSIFALIIIWHLLIIWFLVY